MGTVRFGAVENEDGTHSPMIEIVVSNPNNAAETETMTFVCLTHAANSVEGVRALSEATYIAVTAEQKNLRYDADGNLDGVLEGKTH